jgi:hypothetical protein
VHELSSIRKVDAGAETGPSSGTDSAWPVLVSKAEQPPWFCPVGEVEAVSKRLKGFAKDKLAASLGLAKAHCHWSTQPLAPGVQPGKFECQEPLCVALRQDGRCEHLAVKDTLTSLGVYAAILGSEEDVGRRAIETISDVFSGGHNKVDLQRTKVSMVLSKVMPHPCLPQGRKNLWKTCFGNRFYSCKKPANNWSKTYEKTCKKPAKNLQKNLQKTCKKPQICSNFDQIWSNLMKQKTCFDQIYILLGGFLLGWVWLGVSCGCSALACTMPR